MVAYCDSKQYVQKISETEYRLIEMSLSNPETGSHMVYTDYIDLNDYLDSFGNADNTLMSILDGFGYTGAEEVRRIYGVEANQVMCECVFEMISSHEGSILFTGSEADCSRFITDYVKRI